MMTCCCCLTRRWEAKKGSCCRRRINLVRKFDLARDKLGEELDLVNLLKFQRINKLNQKVSLKRPERLLVEFFKRYIVQNKEVAEGLRSMNTRGMREETMVKDIYLEDPIGARIHFELTGSHACKDDYKDDSSFGSNPLDDFEEVGIEDLLDPEVPSH